MKLEVDNIWTYMNGSYTEFLRKTLDPLTSYVNDGYFFSKAWKLGHWDGRTRFVEQDKKRKLYRFPTGFISRVTKELDRVEYKYELIDSTNLDTFEGKYDLANGLSLDAGKWSFQAEALDALLTHGRGILRIATGGGKTNVGIGVIQSIGKRTAWFIHRQQLAYQTKQRMEECLGTKVGFVGDGTCDLEDVTVLMVQTASKRKEPGYAKLDEWLNGVEVLIGDECFPGRTRILTPYGEHTIKEIVENPFLDTVISHDGEKWVERKIVRKMRRKLEGELVMVRLKSSNGKNFTTLCTPNHKFWTSTGYVEAKDLTKNHTLKSFDGIVSKKYVCPNCGKVFEHPSALAPHVREKCAPQKWFKNPETLGYENIGYDRSKYGSETHHKRISESKMGDKNPSKRPEVRKKNSESLKKWWRDMPDEERKWRIETFINAPRYKGLPNHPERFIIDLTIPNLKYVGDGQVVYKFKDGRNKVPDFVVEGDNRVVEICDFEYWHTHEEMDKVKAQYSEIGVECLVVDAKDVYEDSFRDKLFTWITNHDLHVLYVCKHKAPCGSVDEVFNLEVEVDHNYVANGILVSNCHHIESDQWYGIFANVPATYRFGLTATPRITGPGLGLVGMTGEILTSVDAIQLIELKVLVPPRIWILKCSTPKLSKKMPQPSAYKQGIVENVERHKMLLDCAGMFKKDQKSCITLVKRINHGEILTDYYNFRGIRTEFIRGSVSYADRDRILTDLYQGRVDHVVAVAEIMGEGVDLPYLRAIINATGSKGGGSVEEGETGRQTLQILGRILRYSPGKHYADYVDVSDFGHPSLARASLDRIQTLQSEHYTPFIKYWDNYIPER